MREYVTFDFPGAMTGSQTVLTSIRKYKCKFIITGYFDYPISADLQPASFVYFGNPAGKGKFFILNYPSTSSAIVSQTNIYGSDVLCGDQINLVGAYFLTTATTTPLGFFYSGNLEGTGTWTEIIPSTLSTGITGTICRAVMGDLLVGNYTTTTNNAFLYNVKTKIYLGITMIGATSITANGIWQNSKNHYTICGGFTISSGLEAGYLVDFNNKTQMFSNWIQFSYANDPTTNTTTYFNAISATKCSYTLTGMFNTSSGTPQPFIAFIRRDKCGNISQKVEWQTLTFAENMTGNGIAENVVVGGYNLSTDLTTLHGYISG